LRARSRGLIGKGGYKMPYDEQKDDVIESVADYTNHLENWFDSPDFFYRGQEYPWDLVPKLFRDCEPNEVLPTENTMFEEFTRSSLPYLERPIENVWDMIAVAQHHGMPTRLLDWTTNPLAALWFAVSNKPVENKNGCVWVLPKKHARFVDFAADKSPFSMRPTKFFYPRHVARRISSQAGLFSCHQFILEGEEKPFFALNRNKFYKDHVRIIQISAGHFEKIRSELDRSGVSEEGLYLGLDGLCRRLRWRYLKK
jgi:hypothetical protein